MKTIKYIILAFVAFAVLSCERMDQLFTREDGGLSSFTLDVRCGGLETRSAGDDDYNENTIKHVDYFFFADEAGTQPLSVHARAEAPASGRFLLEFDVENTEAYACLKGTSYVYILANYPTTIDHSRDYTLETILGWPVDKALYSAATSTAQASLADCFVMDSYNPETKKYTVQLTPSKKDDVLDVANNNVQTVNLTRLAVKLTLTLNLDSEIHTTDSFGNAETWTPEPAHTMEIYYVNALNNTTVQASPVKRTENASGSYFTYPTKYPFSPSASNSVYTYITNPVYTYPQSWTADDNGEPYFKLYMSWRSTVKDVAQFYYKIPVPTERTLNRNCWYQVTVQVGVLGGTEDDYVVVTGDFCVADWAEPAWFSGSGLNSAKYFYVPGDEYHIYGDDNISIPYYCNAAVNAYFTSIKYMDYNTDDGSTAERNKPFSGTTNTSVTDYGGTSNHTYTLTPDADNKVVKFEHDMTNLYVERVIKLTIVNTENSSQSKVVTIHQHPAIELKKAEGGNLYVNGRFARVQDARNQNGTRMGVSYNGFYHSPASTDGIFTSGDWHYHSGAGYALEKSAINGYGCLLFQPGWVSLPYFTTDITVTAFSSSNNTYSISGEGSVEYKIGDPRVKVNTVYNNFSLANYLSSGTSTRNMSYGDWDKQGDILIGSTDDTDRNTIAPRFLVCSGLSEVYVPGGIPDGGQDANTLFLNFVKRAATFQEAGYPAGRWRLPTEGEVAFIVARQSDGTIPAIFAKGYPYYCSSGRWVQVPLEGNSLVFGTSLNTLITTSDGDGYVYNLIDAKFVYDLWYWGAQPANTTYVTNQYHPNGHFVSYK